jgi:protein-L-isoaspartate(D-aspartate) O-methyltransferase
MVQGGVEEVPQALIDQLREGGRIGCVFMEGALGVARVGLLQDGHVNWRYAFNAAAPVVEGFEKAREFVL